MSRSPRARPSGRCSPAQAYEEPLHHVGTVTEDDEDLALVAARSIYDEQPWIQMIIVPRSEIREAIQAMTPSPIDTPPTPRPATR